MISIKSEILYRISEELKKPEILYRISEELKKHYKGSYLAALFTGEEPIINTIKISGVQSVYLDFLRQFDSLVSKDPTQNRKFVGILLEVNGFSYLAPMTSPKDKHILINDKAPDVFKLDGGKLGIINLNNMIPVLESTIIPINISEEKDNNYRNLLNKQFLFIRDNESVIKKKARTLYQIVNSTKHLKLNERCCKFKMLEQMSLNFGLVLPATAQEVAPLSQKDLK